MTSVDPWRGGVALAVFVAIFLTSLTLARVHVRTDALVATARAGVQLALVAGLVAWIFKHPEGAALYLGLMLIAASITSARRIRCGVAGFPRIVLAIGAGALAASVPVLASGALDFRPETVVPFAAQIIGGSMTATSLAGVRFRDDVSDHWDVVEGWLALGATPRQAVADLGRRAAGRALIPAIDQTRSAGLVTLPGAFVGLLLGGASPTEAAEVQLLVLAGLLAAESVSAVLSTLLLSSWLGSKRPVAVAG